VDAVQPAIAEHGGRIVKNTGDGFLAEFPSAVGAARAALQFQTRVKELTAADTEDRRIAFRVGINVGDVIIEPHDVFGDGVNIAARLESIAEPGGICVSASAYDQVRGKVGVEFADLGDQNLKNIARAVRAYATLPNKRLANMLNAELTAAEARRAERSPRPNSTDLLFQGKASWNKGPTLPNMKEARGFFERALALDPANIEAIVGIASVDLAMGAALLADERPAFLAAAEANAIKVLSWPT
jgi:hypothetical protein